YFQFVESALFSKELLENMIYDTHQESINLYKLKYNGKLAVHIRRGDFLTSLSANHNVMSSELLSSVFNKYRNRKIVVFSDDIDWCIEKFGSCEFIEFHRGSSAIDDFLALSQCTSYILLGSSFSWWAAFLFSNTSTEVVVEASNSILFNSPIELNKLNCKVNLESFK
ncbi:hypothetical protein J7I09_004118, partial [Vibrio vulnificus]|nr:hypothetical protein [Vibrio vulnificus]